MKTPDQFSTKQLFDLFDAGQINVEQLNHLVRTLRADREECARQAEEYQRKYQREHIDTNRWKNRAELAEARINCLQNIINIPEREPKFPELDKDHLVKLCAHYFEETKRLQSVIDEDNAQEPVEVSNIAGRIHDFIMAKEMGDYPTFDDIYELIGFTELYARPTPAQQVTAKWEYCPECGSDEIRYEEGNHKQCKSCHQEWFSDSDYTDVVRRNLEKRFSQQSPAMQTPKQEPAENPHEWVIEKLSYHKYERDDLSIDDCMKYLASEWTEVSGRTTRQLVMQILSLIADPVPAQAIPESKTVTYFLATRCGFNDGSGAETLQSGTADWKGTNNPQEVFAQMMEVHKTKARDEYKNPNWEKVVATSFSIVSF